jgi:hypothetical protein
MRYSLTFFLFAITYTISAQFSVGHSTSSFFDASRSNREIPCEIYYPAVGAGDNFPMVDGMFPFIVFGHGFVMNYTAYESLTIALVSSGYVLIFVETEGGFAPSHNTYGLDLAFVADYFFTENSIAGSEFENHLIDRCAIMGHSMGGGSSWLAATSSSSVDCIAGLAPAETNPSAIEAASDVLVPSIVLSGSSDAVTPPSSNHIPIYESTASSCRIFVDILEGSHCGYADSGSLCDFGEFGFSGLNRETQQSITSDLLLAFFDFHLKELVSGNAVLQNYDSTQSNVEMLIECLSFVANPDSQGIVVFPNPCSEYLFLESEGNEGMAYSVMDITGRVVVSGILMFSNKRAELNTNQMTAGIYTILLKDQVAMRFLKH